MRWISLTSRALSVVLPLVAACANPSDQSEPLLEALPRPLTAAETRIASAGNELTFALFNRTVAALPADSNAFLSPLSASFALGMTLNGARAATFDAMRTTLGFADVAQPDINAGYRGLIDLLLGLDRATEMRVANAIFTRQGFTVEPAFLAAGRSSFDAEIRALDFASPSAVQTINDWVSGKTSGRIPKLIDALRPDEVLFLVNAIYFKGRWRTPFDRAKTRSAPFVGADGVTRTVDLMSRTGARVRMASLPNAAAAELLYGNGAFAMTIVLPAPGVTPGAVAAGLDAATWSALTSRMVDAEVTLGIPRFRVEYARSLKDDLTALGMGIAFDGGRADFSGIADVSPERLFLSRVLQKAFVQVDEEGTEAAAATGVGVGVTSAPPSFIVDRPFLFLIRERFSGTILFIGQVNQLG